MFVMLRKYHYSTAVMAAQAYLYISSISTGKIIFSAIVKWLKESNANK